MHLPLEESYWHDGALLLPHPWYSGSDSAEVDAEGNASAKLESTATAEVVWDAATAGRTAASEGVMEINSTNIKINRDIIVCLSLAIAFDDFGLVILQQKMNTIW